MGGCARQPEKIEATYVSLNMFMQSSCSQLRTERVEIVNEVNRLTASQKQNANNYAAAMGVELILF